jgi:hypothetical protein
MMMMMNKFSFNAFSLVSQSIIRSSAQKEREEIRVAFRTQNKRTPLLCRNHSGDG